MQASEGISPYGGEFALWFTRWQDATGSDYLARMQRNNPLLIPRNHHVERVIEECMLTGSNEAAEKFLQALRQPYQLTEQTGLYQGLPADGDLYYQTFCGT
jgi:uncharacterized protein YdiU (UPF0061 family)